MKVVLGKSIGGKRRCDLCGFTRMEQVKEIGFRWGIGRRVYWFDACAACVDRLGLIWEQWPEGSRSETLFYETQITTRPEAWRKGKRRPDPGRRARGLAAMRRPRGDAG